MSADYDRIEEFFEHLNSYLCRLKIWESKLPPIPQLKEVIAEILTSVLLLCGICTKYMKTTRMGELNSFIFGNIVNSSQIVNAFKALAGEDQELKLTFDHFQRLVERENGIFIAATLASVQTLALETADMNLSVKENLTTTKRVESTTGDLVTSTERVFQKLQTQETAEERDRVKHGIGEGFERI